MALSQHDLFALAGYATNAMHKARTRHADIISIAAVELIMTDQPHGYDNHLSLTAHYQRDGANSVEAQVRRLRNPANPEHEGISIMPLQHHVRTREDIDEAIELLDQRCNVVRSLIENAPIPF